MVNIRVVHAVVFTIRHVAKRGIQFLAARRYIDARIISFFLVSTHGHNLLRRKETSLSLSLSFSSEKESHEEFTLVRKISAPRTIRTTLEP